jgi:hypothetical protein
VGHPISACDGLYEFDSHYCLLVRYRYYFDPLGELVNCVQEVCVAAM